MVFEKSEISGLDVRTVSAANTLAVLYNACAASVSALALFVIWTGLVHGQAGVFWILLVTIGFVQIMGFVAFAPIGNQRWQVNVALTALYVVGIALADLAIFG